MAKAKAAAAAKAKGAAGKKEEEPKQEEPSPNQPYLDAYVKIIKEKTGEHSLVDYYINKLSKDVPTLVVELKNYYEVMELLKCHEGLAFDYMSELHANGFRYTYGSVCPFVFIWKASICSSEGEGR